MSSFLIQSFSTFNVQTLFYSSRYRVTFIFFCSLQHKAIRQEWQAHLALLDMRLFPPGINQLLGQQTEQINLKTCQVTKLKYLRRSCFASYSNSQLLQQSQLLLPNLSNSYKYFKVCLGFMRLFVDFSIVATINPHFIKASLSRTKNRISAI